MKKRIKHFEFRNKNQNDNGLQMSDLCAYPLVRNLICSTDTCEPYEIIKSKLYSYKGNTNGYGLKISP